MNCPHCHTEIGHQVYVGTEGYNRVSKGQCPHCGFSMPSGYKIEFLSASGLPMSEERAQRAGANLRDMLAQVNAPDNYKRVRFHTAFGAVGLFIILYLSLTMRHGVFLIEIGPLLFSFIISLIFWILPQRLNRRHYHKYVKDQNNPKTAVTNSNIRTISIVISWLIFIPAALILLAILSQIL